MTKKKKGCECISVVHVNNFQSGLHESTFSGVCESFSVMHVSKYVFSSMCERITVRKVSVSVVLETISAMSVCVCM